jgi:excisionase family DNA binding protein
MSTAQIAPAGFRLPGAATYLGASPATVNRAVRAGKIRTVKLNGCRIFPKTALDDFLAGREGSQAYQLATFTV